MSKAKRQRQKAAKAARLQAERKKASRKENLKRLGIGVAMAVVLVAVLVTCSVRDNESAETVSSDLSADYREYREKPTACGADAPPPLQGMTFGDFVTQGITPDSSAFAVVETSCGTVVIELDTRYAATVNSFAFLAREGYYDGMVFHRLVEGFVVQGGDPTATGREDAGYAIPDEYPPEDFQYERGVVAMANAGKNTTGSQFFWMLGDAPFLNPQYNVLGRIVEGLEVLDAIAQVPTDLSSTGEQSLPREAIYIESVTITVES
ncbi:MAG: peptidylprolyl isomerase [bacterium]|nr:peptidylprolyl isomerase [bacterium]MDE0675538.1 peptidylprolyl isomerase [bacterium]